MTNHEQHNEFESVLELLSKQGEVHWRECQVELRERGLCGIRLFISVAHEGLKAARRTVLP